MNRSKPGDKLVGSLGLVTICGSPSGSLGHHQSPGQSARAVCGYRKVRILPPHGTAKIDFLINSFFILTPFSSCRRHRAGCCTTLNNSKEEKKFSSLVTKQFRNSHNGVTCVLHSHSSSSPPR